MKFNRFLFFILLVLFQLSSVAEEPKTLAFKCGYVQNRFLKKSDLKLRSKGYIRIEKNQDVVWMQTEPFHNRVLIQSDKVFQVVDGNPIEMDSPVMQEVAKIMSTVVKGDEESLANHLQVIKKESKSEYIPKEKKLQKVLEKVESEKAEYIKTIKILERGQNSLQLFFSNCSLIP